VFSAIDRRLFLKSAAAFTATLPLVRPRCAYAAEAELIARRTLFDNPDYGSVTISPDGWHLSWLAPVNGVRNTDLSGRPTASPSARSPKPFSQNISAAVANRSMKISRGRR
jgi:hypothetical protein